jgi:hypothetical protein
MIKGQGYEYDKRNISMVICGSADIILTPETLGSVASLLAATICQGHHDMNHKLWNIGSAESYILRKQVLPECYYI